MAGTLSKFDVTTGQQLSSVPITNANGGGAIGLTGMAVNPLTNILYGVSVVKTKSGGNTVAGSLLTIDPTTGKATVLGRLTLNTVSLQVSDIAFAPDGTLYGWEAQVPTDMSGSPLQSYQLATINITPGSNAGHMTNVGGGTQSSTAGGGLALSPTNSNVFYLSNSGTDPDFGTLDSVNRSTGTITTGPSISGAPKNGTLNSMKFFGNTLYAVNSSIDPNEVNESGQPDENHLVTVNLVNGAVTDLFRIPFNNVDAMVFLPVPEPSTLGLLVFGAVGSVALLIYRRRR